jgi:MFS family permease
MGPAKHFPESDYLTAALIAEVVSKRDLPSAVALGGVEFNLSRVLSPPLAGLLIAVAGPAAAFTANAASFIPTVLVMPSGIPVRRPPWNALLGRMVGTISLARTSRAIRSVLARTAIFTICSSVLFSLLPLYARMQLHATPSQFGILFGALGAGSVVVAQVGLQNSILGGTLMLGICLFVFGVCKSFLVGSIVLFAAGFGWFTVLSSLNTAIGSVGLRIGNVGSICRAIRKRRGIRPRRSVVRCPGYRDEVRAVTMGRRGGLTTPAGTDKAVLIRKSKFSFTGTKMPDAGSATTTAGAAAAP